MYKARAIISWLALVAVVVGVPLLLILVVGNPVPTELPDWETIRTSVGQQYIPGTFVTKAIALMVWVVWAQMTWAVAWELVVAGPRVAKGIRTRSAPLVAGPIASLATRIISTGLAAGVVSSAGQTTLPPRIIVAPTEAAVTATPVAQSSDEASGLRPGHYWMVKPGDSLWSISGEDQAVAAQIVAMNSSVNSPMDVLSGLSLRVPTSIAIPDDRMTDPAGAAAEQPESEANKALGRQVQTATEVNTIEDVGRNSMTDDHGGKGNVEQSYWPRSAAKVVVGDSIWGLADARLDEAGEPRADADVLEYVTDVVAENPDVQSNPDLIHPGQILVLPAIGDELPTDEHTEVAESERAAEPATGDDTHANNVGNKGNVVALPSTPSSGSDTEPSVGLYDLVSRRRVDIGLGAGGLLLGASALSLLQRRRQYRMAHRRRGTIPVDPDPRLDDVERLLQAREHQAEAAWLSAALASLSSRPVWEEEHIPVPLLARLDDDHLEVTLAEPDEIGAPVPWQSTEGGLSWRLDRSIPLEDLPVVQADYVIPTFVTIGKGVLINLEGVGVLQLEGGTASTQLGIVRSLVHELSVSSEACWVDIRSTFAISGSHSYPLVQRQDPTALANELEEWLHGCAERLADAGRSSTYALRLSSHDEPFAPVVLVVDRSARSELDKIGRMALERILPIGVVQLGADVERSGSSAPPSELRTFTLGAKPTILRLEADGTAVLEPFGCRLVPQTLSESTANDLGLLLENAASSTAVPLLANVQLSASVTTLAARQKMPVTSTVTQPKIDSPWSALDPAVVATPVFQFSGSPEKADSRRQPELVTDEAPKGSTKPEQATDRLDEGPSGTDDADIDPTTVATEPAPASREPESQGSVVVDTTLQVKSNNAGPLGRQASDVDEASSQPVSSDSEVEATMSGETAGDVGPTKGQADGGMVALVLGEVAVAGFDTELTPQQLSLVTFLACVGQANRATIIDALWDGKAISRSRFPNLLAETRAKIGRHTLPEAKNGLYQLAGVPTDLGRFEELVAKARKQPVSDAIETLHDSLNLIRGVPLTTPTGRYWTWVGDHTHLAARVESLVADAAVHLAELYRGQGDLQSAVWACDKGLLACPLDENLVSSLAETYVALGKVGAARRLVESWEDKITRLDCGEPSEGPRNRLVG